ncbi:hypothetical protein ACLSZ3_02025 [Avibacterium gallinarum]|uniref:hypothetical protein n=1 Tax=Avibacterium gallinarum TaxID=755 RepID=UPI0039FD55D8
MAKIEVIVTKYWVTPLDSLTKKPFRIGMVSAVNPIQQAEVNQVVKLMSELNPRIISPALTNIEAVRKTETLKNLNTETLKFEELKND